MDKAYLGYVTSSVDFLFINLGTVSSTAAIGAWLMNKVSVYI